MYRQNNIPNVTANFDVIHHKLLLIHINSSGKFQTMIACNYINSILRNIGEIGFAQSIIRNIDNLLYEALSIPVDTYWNLILKIFWLTNDYESELVPMKYNNCPLKDFLLLVSKKMHNTFLNK